MVFTIELEVPLDLKLKHYSNYFGVPFERKEMPLKHLDLVGWMKLDGVYLAMNGWLPWEARESVNVKADGRIPG
jgi:hypothetical protein